MGKFIMPKRGSNIQKVKGTPRVVEVRKGKKKKK